MIKFYKINIHSENIDIDKYNQSIIVKRGLIYAKEIVTNSKIMICDNKTQGSMYDYYVLSNEFKANSIVRYDELKSYIDNFEVSKFPMYSNLEAAKVKRLVKRI